MPGPRAQFSNRGALARSASNPREKESRSIKSRATSYTTHCWLQPTSQSCPTLYSAIWRINCLELSTPHNQISLHDYHHIVQGHCTGTHNQTYCCSTWTPRGAQRRLPQGCWTLVTVHFTRKGASLTCWYTLRQSDHSAISYLVPAIRKNSRDRYHLALIPESPLSGKYRWTGLRSNRALSSTPPPTNKSFAGVSDRPLGEHTLFG